MKKRQKSDKYPTPGARSDITGEISSNQENFTRQKMMNATRSG